MSGCLDGYASGVNTVLKSIRRAVRQRAYWVYLLSETWRMMRMRRNAAAVRERDNLELISRTSAFARQSDTLFILGSGASINELNPTFWKHVAKFDSIGFNNWLIHYFVPNFYMREAPRDLRTEYAFTDMLRKKEDYKVVPFILRRGLTARRLALWSDTLRLLRSVPTGTLCLPDVVNAPAETEDEMRKFCRIWRRLGLQKDINLHIDCRASLSQLLYFGFVQGYSDIVLCGIDLNTAEYFWEDSRWKGGKVDLPSSTPTRGQHKTMDPTFGLPIKSVVAAMHDELLKPAGVRLYVARPSSALADFLPVYDFPAES